MSFYNTWLGQIFGLKGGAGRRRLARQSAAASGEISNVLRYRADIDGLRAVAVAGVVLYHVGGFGVTGGYVGVDIFFVISGYLITGILAREIEAGRFSLWNFYQRRIRRILPALVAVVTATTLAATCFLFPDDFRGYGRSLTHLAGFASNLYFAHTVGYFDGAADEKPLLHTWSLAVEEQFYIIFPFLLWLLFRWNRRAAIAALVALACVSFLVAIDQTARAPERAFFSSSARAWELLLGAVCALTQFPGRWPRSWNEMAAAVGLALILFAYLFYSDETVFPGTSALVPCFGAAIVIATGQGGVTAVGRCLSLPPVLGIGLISYSLYLWHWPLLVFAKYRYAFTPSSDHWQAVALVVASVSLAYLSWRFIERPFRRPANLEQQRLIFAGATSILAATALVGVLIVQEDGLPGRWPDTLTAVMGKNKNDFHCSGTVAPTGWPLGTCFLGSPNAEFDTLIWGDSHADMLAPGIARELSRTHRGAVLVFTGSCPPLIGVTFYGRGKRDGLCKDRAAEVLQKLTAGGFRRVILAARWAYYAEGSRIPGESGQPARLSVNEGNHEIFRRLLVETVSRLKPLVEQTILIGPVPESDFPVTRAVARNIAWGRPLPPPTSRAAFERRQQNVIPVLKLLEQAPAVRIIFPDRWLCDANICAYASGGLPLYLDTNHINVRGEKELEHMFECIITDFPEAEAISALPPR